MGKQKNVQKAWWGGAIVCSTILVPSGPEWDVLLKTSS